MRTTLRTPVTPTRDRLTWTAGRRACTSVGDPVRRRLTAVIAGFDDSAGERGCDLATSGVWWPPGSAAGDRPDRTRRYSLCGDMAPAAARPLPRSREGT